MIPLPNDCDYSALSVFPKDWKVCPQHSIKKKWYVQYYFRDLKTCPDKPYGQLFRVFGMNKCKTLPERRTAVKVILVDLENMLQEGFNPILNTLPTPQSDYYISPDTNFLQAMQRAYDNLPKIDSSITSDIRTMLKRIKEPATRIFISNTPIKDIKRRHLMALLKEVQAEYGISPHLYNKYRGNLQMLFKVLVGMETLEGNLVNEHFPKQVVERKEMRAVLTLEERKLIDSHLFAKNYTFWRFMQIFFHSGSRVQEILQVQGKHVDLLRQRYSIFVKKGKQYKWEQRTIKDIALPYWKELMKTCKADDYIFNKDLIPGGEKPIRREQITRRWHTWVKKPLDISADFYSLKHSNLDETAAILDANAAGKAAGHTSTVVTMNNYLVGEKEREHQRLKGVANKFS